MIRIGICDDEQVQSRIMAQIVDDWAQERDVEAVVKLYNSGTALLYDWEQSRCFDVVLLVIQMGSVSGLAVAQQLRNQDDELIIIFVSGYMEFMHQGYQVQAFNYFVKPVNPAAFGECMDKVVKKLEKRGLMFNVWDTGDTYAVPLMDILYFEVSGHYVTLYSKRETLRFKKRLADLERELPSEFIRIHRSFIVNITRLACLRPGKAILSDEAHTELPVGRRREETLSRLFLRMQRNIICNFSDE